MKHIFNVYLKVYQKTETIELPENARHILEVNSPSDLYEPFSDYEHLIDFRKQKAFIISIPIIRMEVKELIFNLIEETYGYTKEDLRLVTRKKENVLFRYVFCYLMKKHTALIVSDIGSIVGLNHTTVLYGVKSIEDILKFDNGWRNEFATNLIDKFNNQTDEQKRCTTQSRS